MNKIIVLLIVIVILGGVYFGANYLQKRQNQKYFLVPSKSPDSQIPSIEIQNKVKKYIEENISTISKEKEVLGGKFYVTNITFLSPSVVLIKYEDGHIALEAMAQFNVDKEGRVTAKIKEVDF